MHWIGICLEHFQPPDPCFVPQRSLVVQPALYYLQHSAYFAGIECCLWRPVGGAQRAARGGYGKSFARVIAVREQVPAVAGYEIEDLLACGFASAIATLLLVVTLVLLSI